MARKRGVFQRFLELVLDKRAAQKTERDTQAALAKATDPKVVKRNLAAVGGFFGDVTRIATQAAVAVAGYALAITKLTERGGKVLQVQRAFTNVVGDTTAALATLRKASGGLISDYDLMVGFNRALTLGSAQNVEQFGEMTKTAIALGRALGVDAGFALESLNLGIARQSKLILDNIGLIVDIDDANKAYASTLGKTVDQLTAAERSEAFRTAALEKARQKIEDLGAASATAADMLTRVKTQFANAKDEVAKFLAQSDALRTVFFELGNVLETFVLAFQARDRDTLVEAFKLAGKLAGTAFVVAFNDAAAAAFGAASSRITPDALERRGMVWAFDVFNSIRRMAEKESAAAGVELEATFKELEEFRERLMKEIGARGEAGGGAGGAPPPPGGGGGTGGAVSVPGIPGRSVAGPEAPGALFGGGVPVFALTEQIDHFAALVDHYRSGMMDIEFAGQTAAAGIQSAFTDAFLALGEEGNAFGNFFEEIFKGSASAAIGAIAQLANIKTMEAIANAVTEAAAALASAAKHDPKGAALHSKSAKGYILAAAKWGALGGAAGAAAAAIESSGGGASSFRGTDAVGRRIDQIDRRGGDIIVYVDPFDHNNPRQQAAIGKAAQQYEQRTGGTIRYRTRGS